MKQNHLALIPCLLLLALHELIGQEAPRTWVPFTATMQMDNDLKDVHIGPATGRETLKIGKYARDGHGNTYQEQKSVNYNTRLREIGPPNKVVIHDRKNQVIYYIYPSKGTFRKERPKSGDLGTTPPTRDDFNRAHRDQVYVGKRKISGIDCEGFRTPAPFSPRNFNETWYAPSLNFMPIKASVYVDEHQRSETTLRNIKVGAEPDENLFRLPEGFREVKR